MPFRTLPRSDTAHLDALESAHGKLGSIRPGEGNPLSAKTTARLTKVLPVYRRELTGRHGTLGQQTEATSEAKRQKDALRLYVTHFFHALNMAIQRAEPGFRAGDRTYYGLAASQETLPKLVREADLLRIAESIVSGEAKRIAAGGPRLTMPTARLHS